MRRAAKIDRNQNEVVEALRKIGYSVQILSMVGKGCPDLLIGARGKNVLIELKDGEKTASRKKLTDDEQKFFDTWRGQVHKAENLEEILVVIKQYL